MKAILPAALLSILLAAGANSEEPAKAKVAVVSLNSMMRDGNFHQRIMLLSLDKDALAAMKKIGVEIKAVRKEIVDAQDQAKLNALQNKLQFLSRKLSLVAQRATSGGPRRDVQALLRDFVIANYKDKYPLIVQPDAGGPDPIVWKGGVELTDITEEAMAKLRERLDEISGGSNEGLLLAYPATPSRAPATTPPPAVKPAPPSLTPPTVVH